MRAERFPVIFCLLFLICGFLLGTAKAEDYTFSGDAALVSKYIWRGQRLTNDWSLQPSATVSRGGFSFNVWGTMDLTAVNEGDNAFIRENPASIPGNNDGGLRGHFSEVDYTFSYGRSLGGASVEGGAIIYTFPQRSSFLPTTTELYGGISFDSVPLSPSATLYLDVDETSKGAGKAGVYVLLEAGHTFAFNHPNFKGLDLSGRLSFANNHFGSYYYGSSNSGPHDASFTVSIPIQIASNWSLSGFLTYSGLLGGFRDLQFQDPRQVHLGTAGSPATFADTVWGGFSFNLSF